MNITRRQALATVALGASASTRALAQKTNNGRAKNVLVIMSDQHKRDCLGAAGDPVAHTPNLDSLAQTSVRFTSAYCTNPVCTPSRASILTGLYTHDHQAWNNTVPWPIGHKTIAHYFNRAGYVTGLVGKMHFVDAQTHGFDYHLDFNDWYQFLGPKTKLYADELGRPNSGSGLPQIDDLWRDFGDPWKGDRELDDREGSVAVGGVSKIPEEDHFESFVARESVRFLQRYGKRQQPFLLICSFLKPHDPFMPAARFANMFRAEDMKLPDTWGKVDLSKVPAEVRKSIEYNGPTPELRDPVQARKRMAYYYGNLAQMDDCAGTVLKTLRDLGLEDETIVVYTSDHGEMLGEHGLWQKFQFYEASCGIPLLIRAPGFSHPGICEMPLSQVGLLPTVAELANVPLSSVIDGRSFAAQVHDPAVRHNQPVFAEYNLRTRNAKYMIRSGDYKYSFWTHDMPELYNLRTDPKEMTNLALDPASKSTVERLKAQLFAWYKPPEIGMP
ncbi:MAG TPA: sulfatase-like hydrolase/transferase [Bryobacteraceae bacterium]|nr:sulfatase-like hydrolase/transferase [Bryobacteraceae bacterium]